MASAVGLEVSALFETCQPDVPPQRTIVRCDHGDLTLPNIELAR